MSALFTLFRECIEIDNFGYKCMAFYVRSSAQNDYKQLFFYAYSQNDCAAAMEPKRGLTLQRTQYIHLGVIVLPLLERAGHYRRQPSAYRTDPR